MGLGFFLVWAITYVFFAAAMGKGLRDTIDWLRVFRGLAPAGI